MADILPFPEFRPDVSSYLVGASQAIGNVVPRADGYGPFASLTPFTAALPAQCRGFFYAIRSDGSIAVFAGTATKLYRLDNTTLAWADVSKALGAYSAVPPTDHWQFAQFGSMVIAVQANTVPQVFNLASSAEFADLGGAPPPSRYIAIVGRFVVLSGLLSTPFRIQWSGLDAITTWTAGINSSDFQDLPDGGVVRGVGGGEYGAIFQDTAIRRMVFVGGPIVFQIERVTQDKGLYAPYSLIRAADMIFFIAAQGLQALGASGVPVPIGKEKFDRTFFANHDASALQYVIGAADPKETRVYWSYRSAGGAAAGFDHLLCYDYALGRASVIAAAGEYIATLSRPGFTLESMDAISGSLDALTFSLDEVSVAASATLSAVGLGHQLGFFTGANLEATLETSEQAVPGRRGRLKGFRPVTDAAACYGAIGARETLQEQAIAYSAEQAVNGRGLCPANVSTRLARARLRIPAGTTWTFATGVEPEFAPEGKR